MASAIVLHPKVQFVNTKKHKAENKRVQPAEKPKKRRNLVKIDNLKGSVLEVHTLDIAADFWYNQTVFMHNFFERT